MKGKKILSTVLSLIMMMSLNVTTYAEENQITAYLNISKYGQFLSDKNESKLVHAPVELSGKESYTLDDVFKTMHDVYYDGGSDAGYMSETGEYGLYITRFWGDESGNFGYQLNGGAESVMGLSHLIEDGDCIDAVIYRNTYPDTESYSVFDTYALEVYPNEQFELTLNQAGYDENWNTVFSPCENALITVNDAETELKTDVNGKVNLSFDSPGEYVVSATKNKTVNELSVAAITAPVCVITVVDFPDACITVPVDATLFVGVKNGKHFMNFEEIEPVYSYSDEFNSEYYFELSDESVYNYRVSGADYVTYGGTFKKTPDFNLEINEEILKPVEKNKLTVDRDTASNGGMNVADIYLNINPQGFLNLSTDETFQIVSMRNWEAVNNTSSNYFIEPDFKYEVIDEYGNESDVVEIDNNGLITARKSGVAIVCVTYDAMTLNYGSDDEFYGAIWPENTGVFIVSVDGEDSGIENGFIINEGKNSEEIKLSGDYIDSEHDCIYFVGDTGYYNYKPVTEGVSVYIANPVVNEKLTYNGFKEVSVDDDGSYSVPLVTGRNIVRLEKDGRHEYQVITARKVNVTVNDGKAVHPGDKINIVFDKLYHPANKLAGVYNMNAIALYREVSGYEGKLIGGETAQYNFADSTPAQSISSVLKEKDVWGVINYEKDADLIIPEDYTHDTFTLSGGALYVSGWGDSYGNHRMITHENGKGANLNADAKLGYFGQLPDIEIPVTIETGGGIDDDTDDDISVYFTLLGDEKHGSPSGTKNTHTKKKNNLETWISKTKIKVSKGSYVIDAVEKALNLNGLTYTNEDSYISEVNGLAEFDNGNLSGWMYTLNGKYPSKGITEQKLSDGDAVVLHYTDDYTVEKNKTSGGGSSSGGSGSSKGTLLPAVNAEKNEETNEKISSENFDDSIFSDVKKNDWYYDSAMFVYEKGLMNGTGECFEPNTKMSRAMLVTILWRMENKPTVNYNLSFKDVQDGEWYTEAVRWGASEKIVSGVSNTEFCGNGDVTREQLVTFLYRYIHSKKVDIPQETVTDINKFDDAENISEYAVSAMKWAVNSGIINGKSGEMLCPADFASRAEAATILRRFYEEVFK